MSSKLNFSCSSYELESCLSLYVTRLFDFRIYFTALVTREFSSLTLAEQFLVPWNRTWPSPPPRVVNQVNFLALDFSCTALQKFISCPGPWRGPTGRFFFFSVFVASFDGFTVWFDPLLCVNLEDWWRLLDCLVFLVISFTMRVEFFFRVFYALSELDNLREFLGFWIKPRDDQFFLPLLREW